MALLDKYGNEINSNGEINKPATPPIPKLPKGSEMSQEEFNELYTQLNNSINKQPIPIPGSSRHITIKCHSILGANTMVLIGDRIKSMYDVSTLSSGQVLPTFALENGVISESEIIQIPGQVMVDSKTIIKLNNGYKIECAPITTFLTYEGMYKEADQLKEGEKLYVVSYSPNNGLFEDSVIISDIHTYHLEVSEIMYLFMAKHSNVLLPIFLNEEQGIMQFISIEQ